MDIIILHTNMNNYIDTHSHILYGIDDGAKTIDDAISILKNLEKLGFSKVILTPHYKNAYHANNATKREILINLKQRVKEENINIELFLANELRICSDILELIKNDEVSLIDNNLFLELPFTNNVVNLYNTLFELQSEGINVILVHPERYSYLTNDDYKKLIEHDIKLQVNYESIIGKYGHDAKKRSIYLFKNNMVEYLGTDVHRDDTIMFSKFSKIEKKIKKLVGEEKYQDLVFNNISKILK